MNRVFKTRYFSRWMRKTQLTDSALCAAVAEMKLGLVDADLGGGVFKKRVAFPGRGKSGSARTLVATQKAQRWFFVFGFEKSERDNITVAELEAVQHVAADLFRLTDQQLDAQLTSAAITEICDDDKDQEPQ
jgi:hypothetical protein